MFPLEFLREDIYPCYCFCYIYINGIEGAVKNCELLMFVDDLKLYSKIESVSDFSVLQNDLNNLASWCSSIGLQLNVNKCNSMAFLKHSFSINYSYAINGSSLTSVCSQKGLGVLFNSDLIFHSHIETECRRDIKTLGFIVCISKEFNLSSSLISLLLLFDPIHSRVCICPLGSLYSNRLLSIRTNSEKILIFRSLFTVITILGT